MDAKHIATLEEKEAHIDSHFVDLDYVTRRLVVRKIFNANDMQNILVEHRTKTDQIRCFLSVLSVRGKDAFPTWIEILESSAEEKNRKLAQLLSSYDPVATRDVDDVEQKVAALRQVRKVVESQETQARQLQTVQDDVVELKSRESKLDELQLEMARNEELNSTMKYKVNKNQAGIISNSRQIKDFESKIEAVRRAADKRTGIVQETLAEKEREITDLQKKIEDLKARLKESETENADLKKKISELDAEMEILKSKYDFLDNRFTQLQDDFDVRQNQQQAEIAELQSSKASMEDTVQTLKKQFEEIKIQQKHPQIQASAEVCVQQSSETCTTSKGKTETKTSNFQAAVKTTKIIPANRFDSQSTQQSRNPPWHHNKRMPENKAKKD